MKKICENCGYGYFEIEIKDECSDCIHNGAYIESDDGNDWDYIYDEKQIKDNNLQRDQAENDGECRIGQSNNAGCHLYICINCKHETNLPFAED